MPRPKKNQGEERKEVTVPYKDYDVFNEEVYQAVKEGRVVKVGSRWRVYPKKDRE